MKKFLLLNFIFIFFTFNSLSAKNSAEETSNSINDTVNNKTEIVVDVESEPEPVPEQKDYLLTSICINQEKGYGWRIYSEDYTQEGSRIVANDVIIKFVSVSNYSEEIHFDNIVIDNGKVISCTPNNESIVFSDTYVYFQVKSESMIFKEDGAYGPGLYVKGTITHSFTEEALYFDDYEIYVDADGPVSFPYRESTNIKEDNWFHINGWEILSNSNSSWDFTKRYAVFGIDKPIFYIPNTNLKLHFDSLKVDLSGEIVEGTVRYDGSYILKGSRKNLLTFINGFRVDIDEYNISEDSSKIALEVWIDFPKVISKQSSLDIDELFINSKGEFLVEDDLDYYNYDYILYSYGFNGEYIYAEEFSIPVSFSENDATGSNFKLYSNGIIKGNFNPIETEEYGVLNISELHYSYAKIDIYQNDSPDIISIYY